MRMDTQRVQRGSKWPEGKIKKTMIMDTIPTM